MKLRSLSQLTLFAAALFSLPLSGVTATGDEHWAHTFGGPGPSNSVYAIAIRGDAVYASGFWSAGPISTTNWIEVWDGSSWSALPGLFTGSMPIFDAVFVGNDLYVCGFFSAIDGLPANGVAKWNGQSWTALGDVEGLAFTLATDGTNLFAGGNFTGISGVAATNIAQWNGQSWSGLGPGLGVNTNGFVDSFIKAVIWHDGALYAGGDFTNSGDQMIQNLARWTGSSWVAVGGDLDGDVYALASSGANLYAGGAFMTAGGVSARSIARWNGSAWSPLGSGLIGNVSGPVIFSGPVFAIGVLGTNVIAGGSFTNAGGMRVSRIARWDGNAWFSMGAMNDVVQSIRVSGTNAYIGGIFTQADDYIVNHLARWDGTRFSALGRAGRSEGAVFPGLRALAAGGGRVYAGGLFTGIGRVKASRIACWDGTNWSALGSGVIGTNTGTGTAVNAIAVSDNGDVYAGGSFTNAGGVAANNIARWNGTSWFPLGNGIPGSVSAIAVRGGDVFVGGTFTMSASGGTAFNIAKWDGGSWSALPGIMNGTIGNFFINAIAIQGSDVYVGGSFNVFNFESGQSGSNIARHDGIEWWPLGTGVSSNVNAIVVVGSDVYAGGRFSSASGVAASRIAKWNGSSWSSLAGGVSGTGNFSVSALAAIGSHIYAAGNFTNAGGVDVNRIAKWNRIFWSPLGSAVSRSVGNPSVLALAANGSDLYVGGNFEGAGGKPAYYIAQWNETRDFDFVPFLRLSKPLRLSDRFRFSIFSSGVPSYVIEASSNLMDWVPITTNTAMSIAIDDFQAPGLPHRFYRAQPGPP